MKSLPVHRSPEPAQGGCGTTCGAGLEKIYPTTAVRYGAMGWIGEFRYPTPTTVFKCGAKVVIQTDRGAEIGDQVSLTCNGCSKSVSREQIKRYVENSGSEFYRLASGRILREAEPPDLDEHARLNAHVREDIDRASLIAAQLDLDMKVVTVEHLLGGERVVFYFRSDERVDFRQMVRELVDFHHTRVEMRQVGARDEARLVADYEICGRECCCKNFLKKLRPVNMRMAKLQKSTLDPAKVSGRCGRLRCCLRYEHEGYESLDAKLPRLGTFVDTSYGAAGVVGRQVLTQLVMVRTHDQREITIPVEEILALDLPAPDWARGWQIGAGPQDAGDSGSSSPAERARPSRGRGPDRARSPRGGRRAPDADPFQNEPREDNEPQPPARDGPAD